MVSKPEPSSITLDATSVTIMWKDGHRSVYSARQLRLLCPCAQCVEEWTGRALLNPMTVQDGIYAVEYMPIGQYAVQFLWSDAHYTGIYTHLFLREVCPCEVCSLEREGSPAQEGQA